MSINKTPSVLHGFSPSAGQPALLARALRSVGVDAANVAIGPNKYNYISDYQVDGSKKDKMRDVLSEFLPRYDIVHIHAVTPFFVSGPPTFPMGTDLLAMKLAGKKIVIHFRGSEVRIPSLFKALSPFNYVDDDPDGLIAKYPDEKQVAYIELCRCLADEILVTDEELRSYVPEAKILPRVVDLNDFKYIGLTNPKRPLIIHAPSRRGVKGTNHVISAVEALKSEGLDFDFKLIEGMSQAEAKENYRNADIIIDQLRIGWYGVLAVEGMAMGKCVVSYIREDLLQSFDGAPPVQVATPDTIRKELKALISSPELRQQVAQRGFEYCNKTHSMQVVGEQCKRIYENMTSQFNLDAYLHINAKQEEMLNANISAAKKLGAKNAREALLRSTQTPTIINITPTDLLSLRLLHRVGGVYKREGFSGVLERVKRLRPRK